MTFEQPASDLWRQNKQLPPTILQKLRVVAGTALVFQEVCMVNSYGGSSSKSNYLPKLPKMSAHAETVSHSQRLLVDLSMTVIISLWYVSWRVIQWVRKLQTKVAVTVTLRQRHSAQIVETTAGADQQAVRICELLVVCVQSMTWAIENARHFARHPEAPPGKPVNRREPR